MGILSFFRSKPANSAAIAKERLQVVIAHERSQRKKPDYLPLLKSDILDVIRRYVDIDDDGVDVRLEKQEDCDVLELNVVLTH